MKHPVKVLPLALALALVATDAEALGLGTLEVKSQLSQPLVAEIPLIGIDPGELENLSVRLASPEAFDRVGLPRPAGTTANLQFSVGRNARGEPVVRVTTSGRVNDPFVAFLLEADWGKGSVVREFTALIDPPHIAAASVTPMAAPAVAAAAAAPAPPTPPARPQPMPEPEPIAEPAALAAPEPLPIARDEPQAEARPAAPVEPPAPVEPVAVVVAAEPAPAPAAEQAPAAVARPDDVPTGLAPREVAEGETLWSIAAQNRQGATVAQMMLAIQRANPDAFLRENINLLRRGAVLRIPTANEAQDLATIAAEAQVREQMLAWRATQPVPMPAPAPGEAPVLAPPPAMTAAARAPARAGVAAGNARGARLEIAPPSGEGAAAAQSGAASGGAGSELRAELQQVREDLSARDAELREVRSRLTEQEALANEQKRLIELKDSQLSALEQSLRQQREAQALAAADAAAAAVTPEAPAAGPATEAVEQAVAEPVAQAAAEPVAQAAAEASPAAAPATDAAPVTDAAAATPWFRQPLVIGGAGVVLVGALVALLLRRRRPAVKMPLAAASASGAPRSRLSEDADFLSNLPTAAADDAPDHALRPAATGSLGEGVGEPVVSPDARRAADLDAQVSLLREHYNAGRAEAFLEAAERMRESVTEPGDPRWREVVVMGMGLVPGHALFRELQWNPVASVDVRTRAPAVEATQPASAAPAVAEPEPFSERETAERPAVDVPRADETGMDDTRLELAKAYIEIGDADGARGMLEEVLAEGSPAARAEAERLLKQIG